MEGGSEGGMEGEREEQSPLSKGKLIPVGSKSPHKAEQTRYEREHGAGGSFSTRDLLLA